MQPFRFTQNDTSKQKPRLIIRGFVVFRNLFWLWVDALWSAAVRIALDDDVPSLFVLALALQSATSHLVCDPIYAIVFAAIRG
jgi:hypothetical protein